MQNTKRNYITTLSVISCLAVVLLHANGVFWSFSYDRYWITANAIESVCYFAVPIFFMISGATLIDYRKRYSTKVFFQKRILKTVVPFLIWSIIGLVYLIARGRISVSELSFLSVLNSVLNCRYVSIYWFFPAIFTIYLSIPLFAFIPEERRKSIFLYIIALAFLLNYFLPFLSALTAGKLQFNLNFTMPLGANYLIYILLGYCLDRYDIQKVHRIIIYCFGFLGLALHLGGTWYLSYKAGAIVSVFKGYDSVPCFLYSTAVFVFLKYAHSYFDAKHSKAAANVQKFLAFFSKETFGIYLIHWFILDLSFCLPFVDERSIVFRVAGGFVIFLISWFIVNLLQKIPYIGKLLVP